MPGISAFNAGSLSAHIASQDRRHIVVCYANSQARIATFLPLGRAIARAGHASYVLFVPEITVSGKLVPDDLRNYSGIDGLTIGTLPVSQIPAVTGVEVFFSSEVFGASPQGSRTVRTIHSLPDGRLNINYASRIQRNPHLARTTDYLVIPIRQTVRAWNVENYLGRLEGTPPPVEATRRPRLDIVPAGYPKIEFLEEEIPVDAPRRNIVFCPTATTVSHSRMRSHGSTILRELLAAFPEHRIVFRPYPKGGEPDFDEVVATLRDEPRFVHDTTLSGIDYFREAALAVTDRSSAAVSFSMATGRPSVFFHDEQNSDDYTDDPLGYRVSTIRQLIASVRDGLADPKKWREQILRERTQFLYNPGAASDYLARSIPIFAGGGSSADWLSIPRDQLHSQS